MLGVPDRLKRHCALPDRQFQVSCRRISMVQQTWLRHGLSETHVVATARSDFCDRPALNGVTVVPPAQASVVGVASRLLLRRIYSNSKALPPATLFDRGERVWAGPHRQRQPQTHRHHRCRRPAEDLVRAPPGDPDATRPVAECDKRTTARRGTWPRAASRKTRRGADCVRPFCQFSLPIQHARIILHFGLHAATPETG